jgi:hypothetical protein
MAKISADRFNALKALVKAECQRRKYTGSVESYGGTAYDFAAVPQSGNTVLTEHYSQNLIPMNAINSTTFPLPVSYGQVIREEDIALMESNVVSWASREQGSAADNSASDCAASCTGLCHSCTGQCVSGCSDTCTGTCSGTCSDTCTGTCSDTCTGTCSNACTGCGGDCANCAYYWGG